MSGKRRSDVPRRQRSPSLIEDEDSDFQYALKLSAELNGDLGGHAEAAAAAAKRQADYEADLDFAVQMQFKDEAEFKDSSRTSSRLQSRSVSSLAAAQATIDKTATMIIDTGSSSTQTSRPLSVFQDCLKASKCAKCGCHLLSSHSDVTTLFDEWCDGKSALSSLLECKSCGTSSCMTCTSTKFSRRSLAVYENKSVSWCCTDGRLLVIWMLLCGFDISYCKAKVDSTKEENLAKEKPPPSFPEKTDGKTDAKGKGKAKAGHTGQRSGIGYGGSKTYQSSWGYDDDNEDEDEDDFEGISDHSFSHLLDKMKKVKKSHFSMKGPGRTISDDKSKAYTAQQALDDLATLVLGLLEHLLPALDRGHAFDISPPAMTADLLVESRMLDYCSDLLRNDSLDELTSRRKTYDTALDFVKALGTHYVTAHSTVFSKRPQQPELCNLVTQTYQHIDLSSQATVPSIAESLCDLSKVGDLVLKNVGRLGAGHEPRNDRELLSLCRKISDLWKLLSLSAPVPITEAESSESGGPLEFIGTVALIKDVPDDQICGSHTFATKAQAQSHSAPGRLKRLISEISILKSSLPPNIFVRHGESRLDMMVCVIVGPEDTPYENGLFEFDIYCPSDYPKSPPKVSFKGTGGGRHGINPNLYADGKVCLSLLGTWSGEPWKPGESTLLQVLVSLQAMVFCEQPWYNEPGRESDYGSAHSKSSSEAYNRMLRELTVRLAMIGWLENVSSIWVDVVEQHFKSNADKILRTVIEWEKQTKAAGHAKKLVYLEDFDGEKESGYRKLLPKLHEQLQKYGATVALPEPLEEEVEPQAKRARVEDSQAEGSQHSVLPPMQDPFSAWPEDEIGDDAFGSFDSIGAFTQAGAQRGGFGGRGVPFPGYGYGFRGRGHVLGAGPGGTSPAPPAPPAPSYEALGGRGGLGRGSFPWVGRGGPGAEASGAPSAFSSMFFGRGRKLGDGDGSGHVRGKGGGFGYAAHGGRGGRGGRGGDGGSMAGA